MKLTKIISLMTTIIVVSAPIAYPADLKDTDYWADTMIDAALRYDFKGIGLNYYEFGTGDPIIMLHGFGASAYSFRKIADLLADNYRVILIDMKGFGYSHKPKDDKYSAFDQAEIIASFIRGLELQNVTLLGNSYGGGIALFTCLRMQDEGNSPVKRLILIDSAGYEQKIPLYIAVLRVPVICYIVMFLTPDKWNAGYVLQKAYFNDELISEEMPKNYAAPLSTKGAGSALISTADHLLDKDVMEMSKRYKEIEAPTLIIWGEKDEIIPLFIGKRFDKEIPDSELHIFPECGHVPQEEMPEKTVEVVKWFMGKVSPPFLKGE